jgi:O-acetyl-ADP-ribose deacetylase (regulator of RNase III)
MRSIAFPAISTGIYGFPSEPAANIAVNTARQFVATDSLIQEIVFCCFSEADLARYQSLLAA